MSIPLKKITHKFIIPNFHFLPFFTFTGGSGFVRLKHKVRNFGGVGVKMGSTLDTNDCNSKKRAGSVLPASEEFANEAVEAVKSGEIIAAPTDTLYGFACDACSKEAVNKIYDIKGRKHTSPLAICVGDVSDIKRFAATDHLPETLLHDLLPGPVTLVLKRGESSILEKSLNPRLDSIGVRVPDNNFIRIICRGSGSALALTSANLSGQLSSVCIKDFGSLWEHCAYVFDGGELPLGRAGSTVVDLINPGKFRIIRPGSFITSNVFGRYMVVASYQYSVKPDLGFDRFNSGLEEEIASVSIPPSQGYL